MNSRLESGGIRSGDKEIRGIPLHAQARRIIDQNGDLELAEQLLQTALVTEDTFENRWTLGLLHRMRGKNTEAYLELTFALRLGKTSCRRNHFLEWVSIARATGLSDQEIQTQLIDWMSSPNQKQLFDDVLSVSQIGNMNSVTPELTGKLVNVRAQFRVHLEKMAVTLAQGESVFAAAGRFVLQGKWKDAIETLRPHADQKKGWDAAQHQFYGLLLLCSDAESHAAAASRQIELGTRQTADGLQNTFTLSSRNAAAAIAKSDSIADHTENRKRRRRR